MADISMTIEINQRDLDEVYALLQYVKGGAERAIQRAINKTLPGVRTDGTQILYDHYNLTKKAIRGSFQVFKAGRGRLSGAVVTKGESQNLIEFGAKAVKAGVSVKVLRGKPRSVVPGAFIITIKSGKKIVVDRKWAGAKRPVKKIAYAALPRQYRYPIKGLFGPRIQDYLGDMERHIGWQQKAATRLEKNIQHEAEFLIHQKLESGDGFLEATG